MDGSSNTKGSGAGVILEGPNDLVIEWSLKFDLKTSNKQEEYEALIVGLKLVKETGAKHIRCRSDSQLVTGQISGNYQTKESQLTRYLCLVESFLKDFDGFIVQHIPREENTRVDLLSKLASTKRAGVYKTVNQETLAEPRILLGEV